MQIWPWCRNEPQAPDEEAASMSASSSTMNELLPPSSSATRLRFSPQAAPTLRPAAVEPVNDTKLTSGAVQIAAPASRPPGSTCSTPSGSPASSKMRANT
jgi:hypothetical protein